MHTFSIGFMGCVGLSLLALVGCGETTQGLADSRTDTPDSSSAFQVISGPTAGSVIGYDAIGTPPVLRFSNNGRAALCRSGHVPEVSGLAFADCPAPGTDGSVAYAMQLTSGKSDGAYEFQVQHTDATGTVNVFSLPVYINRTLTGATQCGQATAGWPSDDKWFEAATATMTVPPNRGAGVAWINPSTHQGALPHSNFFVNMKIDPPFYELPFVGLRTQGARYFNGTTTAAVTANTRMPIVSLRHRIVANADNTLILIHRTHESRAASRNGAPGVCTVGLQVGRYHPHGNSAIGLSEDWTRFACDALVLNSSGEGVCLVRVGGVPAIAMFSTSMAVKLGFDTSQFGTPGTTTSVFGPKVVDRVGMYPDSMTALPTRPHAPIVRP